ncbi:hypothetical protein Pan258_60400 [Symmachiella dynata]|nr:hypothetical protein Pan258_60400 [Symmachiella dynata]
MSRFILLILAIHMSCDTSALADDYLVRLDKIGYVEQSVEGAEPKEKVLQSIEVIARPDSPFRAKVVIGMKTEILAGKLRRGEKNDFTIDIQYHHIVDTGDLIPTEDGRGKPRLNITKMKTTLTISEGKPILMGGIDTGKQQDGQLKSKSRYVLVVTKYQPSE